MSPHAEHLSPAGHALLDRRRFLSSSATALGSIALTNLLGLDGLLAADRPQGGGIAFFTTGKVEMLANAVQRWLGLTAGVHYVYIP